MQKETPMIRPFVIQHRDRVYPENTPARGQRGVPGQGAGVRPAGASPRRPTQRMCLLRRRNASPTRSWRRIRRLNPGGRRTREAACGFPALPPPCAGPWKRVCLGGHVALPSTPHSPRASFPGLRTLRVPRNPAGGSLQQKVGPASQVRGSAGLGCP